MTPQEINDIIMRLTLEQSDRRQQSIESLKAKYMDSPLVRDPIWAFAEGVAGHPAMGGAGNFSWGPAINAANRQRAMNFQNSIMPEMVELEYNDDEYLKSLNKVKEYLKSPWETKFSNDLGIWRINKDTGDREMLVSGSLYARHKQAIYDQLVEKLSAEKSGASMAEIQQTAERMAEKLLLQRVNNGEMGEMPMLGPKDMSASKPPVMTSGIKPVPDMVGKELDSSEIITGKDLPSTFDFTPDTIKKMQADPAYRKMVYDQMEKNSPGMGADLNNWLDAQPMLAGKPTKMYETGKEPTVVGKVDISDLAHQPMRTPQQVKAQEELGKEESRKYIEYKDQNSSFLTANAALLPMEGILLSGKTTSGQAHELLNKAGGYFNYLDPNSQLAQSSQNDTAYFGKMMDLVRDKIKALGAGTAVSNLDLITTQRSVGDLRNTPQGNLKIIGLMKLFNATMSDLNNRKIDYYDSNKNTFQGYKHDGSPLYAIKPIRNKYGKGSSIYSYDLESKEEWQHEVIQMNGGKMPPGGQAELDRAWKNYADDSVREMFK